MELSDDNFISYADAAEKSGLSQGDLFAFIREEKLNAYECRNNAFISTNVDELLEDERYATFLELPDVRKIMVKKNILRIPPFGGGVGRAMLLLEIGLQREDVPALNQQMINKVFAGLFFQLEDIKMLSLTPEEFVKRQQDKGTPDELIACELNLKYDLSAKEIALKLNLADDLNKNQHKTIKQRGQRLINKGKKLIENS